MEKQEMEMKWKLEMETGNWKLETELETEMETQPFSCCSPREVRVVLAFLPGSPELSSPPVFHDLLC